MGEWVGRGTIVNFLLKDFKVITRASAVQVGFLELRTMRINLINLKHTKLSGVYTREMKKRRTIKSSKHPQKGGISTEKRRRRREKKGQEAKVRV
jgi:hypothetical protein